MTRRRPSPRGRRRGAGHGTPRARPLSAGGLGTCIELDGIAYQVRSVTGAGAVKSYRCPHCAQEIPAGTSHVVVWPEAQAGGVSERRHWHTGCWRRVVSRRSP